MRSFRGGVRTPNPTWQATCTVNVTFTLAVRGKRTAEISLKDSVPGSPQSISLEGKGT